ncbi:alpha-D-ribose 1-methylphosphonate 5-triphosphate diphosphatase [Oceaniglobus roseus]|uniref:alpha-D-ribose 1-methylphosphonate 5-triphosphate diphosphatase n=1 Tax=Oceaniglobus roseus TaxID=1737570 RepID=UPI000C7F745C|nr:alpha-D-ribose 1-methylphosphonate 5-triphosphate diphosphatase [Kandeliimicrobium roseum]
MTPPIDPLRLCGATCLRDGRLSRDDIAVVEGRLAEGGAGAPALDLSGYLLLPGIVDLHGDAFERHLAPRPSAPFPPAMGLAGVDRDAAASGVTTAFLAQSWSWEGGSRGPDAAERFLAELEAHRPAALTDLQVQLRCETHTPETEERLVAALRRFSVRYVVFNNHLPEALEMAEETPAAFAAWAARTQRSPEAFREVVRAHLALAPQVPRYLCNLATVFDNLGVTYGSHDDPDARTRDYFGMIGAKICEFPTRAAPALQAKVFGNPVLMGAPNVVRGQSQTGNIPALALIREGLCDALVSDYHYPALAAAAFRLSDLGVMPLAEAWAMISTVPARLLGLKDRGRIAPGLRADLTLVHAETRRIEGTLAAGRWSWLSGDLAGRLSRLRPQALPTAHAAE